VLEETLFFGSIWVRPGVQELKIVVCVRRVPDTATRIKVAPDGKSIVTSDAEFVINPYEEYALEQGVQLKERHGGEVTVLTLGPEKSISVILKALALGADRAIHLKSENFPDDPSAVARALAAELKTVEFDVLLFGKKGVDDDNQQVGPMVAELLGIPCVTQIVKLDISAGKAAAHREVEGGVVVVEASLPSAFTAEKDLTVPRYASLRELVAARKKPILVKDPQQFLPMLEIVSIQYPPPRPPGRVLGKGIEAVPILVKVLHEEAKVI
jgi:electron transfer flavoprotein beta subunit